MNLYNFDLIECVYVKILVGHGRKLADLGYKRSAKKCKEKFVMFCNYF
jgi:hypothetical protein